MGGRTFLTVAEELLETAGTIADGLEEAGYRVVVEDRSFDCPYMPTLTCSRSPATLYVHIDDGTPARTVVREWIAYCKSRPRDSRFAIGVPSAGAVDIDYLRSEGVGVFAVGEDARMVEILNPHDQALNIQLPSLQSFPNKVRAALGGPWEEVRRGNWREGFDAACVAFEMEVRRYLKRHVKRGRLKFRRQNGNAWNPTEAQIEKMTMGQMKDLIAAAVNPNHGDSTILKVLKSLNPDRILVAHKRGDGRAEAKLRRAVPQHLWEIVRGVEQAVK